MGAARDEAEAAPASIEAETPPRAGTPPSALTPRALVLGSLIGALMCLSNLYVGLKTGLAFPAALIACVVGLGVQRSLLRLSASRFGPLLSLQETSAMQSAASSAGYSTGGTIVTASVAWLLLAGQHPPVWALLAWTLLSSALGVVLALPMQRAFIRHEPLPFPSGMAAASVARSLHAGDASGRQGARALGVGALGAGLVALARDGFQLIPVALSLPGALLGVPLSELTFSVELMLLPLGTGAIVGVRTGASLLLGALVCFGGFAPWLLARGDIAETGYYGIIKWSMWPGAALVMSASFTHLALQRGLLRRTFGSLLGARRAPGELPEAADVPRSWFLSGVALLTLGLVTVGAVAFGIPFPLGLLGVLLSFALAAVACRATGETDMTPSGTLGHVAQLAFGGLMPGNVLANTVAASLSGNIAASSADLLTDVKAGSLLGVAPRQTFLAQLWGCLVGSALIVPVFYLLVPDTSAISEERFPAPPGFIVAAVARVLSSGLSGLNEAARWGALVGALLGVTLVLLERFAPEPARRFIPSPIGLGIAFVLPASTSLSVFLGAVAAALLARSRPALADAATVPLASGLIVGESLVSLAVLLVLSASS
ncbi:OPT family oligopeptide transporter [Archangium lansingense]|uniref:OPT/YSL family transporter n=1 Tax=Archangium lansingense TaxID=2995310 RepID=A0ABT3ZVK2_9BACT|nr:OPT family oligopeptide transporter [Archangium lansinium]MCY1073442.1 OPT/YSL family transporter [Archangium lansinium]